MKLEFRLLNKEEVEVRLERMSPKGAFGTLYKNARVDQEILDEKVGSLNWQRRHPNGPQTCVISIWDEDKHQWIEKEDMGGEYSNEYAKGQASDSFKRAGFCWGIGRELYTCPKLFIPRDCFVAFNEKDGRACDPVIVSSLTSEISEGGKKRITGVTLDIMSGGKPHHRITYPGGIVETLESAEDTKAPETQESAKEASVTKKVVEQPDAPASEPAVGIPEEAMGISDDTVVLIGNCRGKRYGDVKDSDQFKSFLKWAKASTTSYPDADKQAQYEIFKKMEA